MKYYTFLAKEDEEMRSMNRITTQNWYWMFRGREVREREECGVTWQQSSGDWMVHWGVKRRPGRWERPDRERRMLSPRHKVNIFPQRYCELGIWLKMNISIKKGKLFYFLGHQQCMCVQQTKSIWKLLCDDLSRPLGTWHTLSIVHWDWIPHTSLDKENGGRWYDNNLIETSFCVTEGRNFGKSIVIVRELPDWWRWGKLSWELSRTQSHHWVVEKFEIPFFHTVISSWDVIIMLEKEALKEGWETQSDNDHVIRKMFDIQFMKLSTLQEIFKLDYI